MVKIKYEPKLRSLQNYKIQKQTKSGIFISLSNEELKTKLKSDFSLAIEYTETQSVRFSSIEELVFWCLRMGDNILITPELVKF